MSLGLLPACSADPTAGPEPPPSSLTPATVHLSSDGDHLAEIARHGDVFLITDSNDTLSAVRLTEAGGLEVILDHVEGLGLRCTTVDIHGPSDTAICSNEYDGRLYRFGLADPTAPAYLGEVPFEPDPVPVRDLHVWGDHLYIAAFGFGLWQAAISEDGMLGSPELVASPGNVRRVEHLGDALVLLVADRGLVVLEPDGEGWTERAVAPLEGPSLDLAVRDDRAAVAMGSAGVAVFDLSAAVPRRLTTVHPPAVAVSADLHGTVLAVGALSGLFTYDLTDPDRPFGFVSSGEHRIPRPGTMLDLVFIGEDDLLVTDWSRVHRFAVDRAGSILDLDVPNGFYLGPDDPLAFEVRNPSNLDMQVEIMHFADRLGRASIPARTTTTVTLDDGIRDTWFPPDVVVDLQLLARDEHGAELGWNSVVVVRAREDHDPATEGQPGPGELFPSVWLALDSVDHMRLPLPEEAFRAIFFTEDCMAMWPEVQDAAWLWRQGRLDAGATPVLVTTGQIDLGHPEGVSFAARFGVEDVPSGFHENVPTDVADHNAPLEPLYDHGFALHRLESAAAHPSDYLVDATGRVVAAEREYRGAFPLRAVR